MAFSRKERNKLLFGIVLLGIAGFALYYAFSTPVVQPPPATTKAPAARTSQLANIENPNLPAARRRVGARGAAKAPSGPVDPKLRLDLLVKTASVTYEPAGGRNVFAYGAPPPPPIPKPVAPPVRPGGSVPGSVGSLTPTQVAPAPPPIPLKFYGYANKPNDPVKKAFLTQDDSGGTEIFIAGEGDIVNKRYRILKIGVNTIEVEDTTTKSRQVLPLLETPSGL